MWLPFEWSTKVLRVKSSSDKNEQTNDYYYGCASCGCGCGCVAIPITQLKCRKQFSTNFMWHYHVKAFFRLILFTAPSEHVRLQ